MLAAEQVWLKQPLVDAGEICARHDVVEAMVEDVQLRDGMRDALTGGTPPVGRGLGQGGPALWLGAPGRALAHASSRRSGRGMCQCKLTARRHAPGCAGFRGSGRSVAPADSHCRRSLLQSVWSHLA